MRATQRAAIQSLVLDDIGYYHLNCLKDLCCQKPHLDICYFHLVVWCGYPCFVIPVNVIYLLLLNVTGSFFLKKKTNILIYRNLGRGSPHSGNL